MRLLTGSFLALAFMTLFAGSANACEARFGDLDPDLDLRPNGALESVGESEIALSVETGADADCDLFIAFAQDPAGSTRDFPISLIGPNGEIRLQTTSGDPAIRPNSGFSASLVADSRRTFNLRAQLPFIWGMQAGLSSGTWRVALIDRANGDLLDIKTLGLTIDVPQESSIRFAGDVRRLDLGQLSSTSMNVAPQYAMRILSTSSYRLTLESDNKGRLARTTGGAFIPYEFRLKGVLLDLASDHIVSTSRGTSRTGDQYPILVRVAPDEGWLAGDYLDRISVTVTPI